jgi:hypothetical protein
MVWDALVGRFVGRGTGLLAGKPLVVVELGGLRWYGWFSAWAGRLLALGGRGVVAMASPERVDGGRLPDEAFLSAVRARVRQAGLGVAEVSRDCGQPVHVVRLAVQRQVGDWPLYRRVLEVCGADQAVIARFHAGWKRARPGAGAAVSNVVPISSRGQQPPVVPVEDDELCAADAGEFIALLRLVQVRSGLSPAQIAVRSEIPRSTAYRFVDNRKNTALPTKVEQVKAFLVGCRLPEHQVRRVVLVWTDLREAEAVQRSSAAEQPPVEEVVDVQADRSESAADSLRWLADEIAERSSAQARLQADFVRWGLAVAYVLVATALAGALVILTSGWTAGTQVLAIMLVFVLSAGLAASWCANVGRWTERGPRPNRSSPTVGLVVEAPGAAPAVIGLEK